MKRQLPLVITFFVGMLVIVSQFIPHQPFGSLAETLQGWFLIISGFAILLGQLNLLKVNIIKISRKSRNWQYYIICIVSFAVMVIAGILWGTQDQPGLLGGSEVLVSFLGRKPFDYFFKYFFENLSATMFSLLAFFMASASYRAFRARNLESSLLLISAFWLCLVELLLEHGLRAGSPNPLLTCICHKLLILSWNISKNLDKEQY